jgi:hypothetical protein
MPASPGERPAAGSDCCPDLVAYAVSIHDHEITADGPVGSTPRKPL